MLERRPLWGLIVLLNVCVVIWRMQEPAVLSVEYDGGVAESGANANTNAQQLVDEDASLRQHHQQQTQHQHQQPGRAAWPNGIAARNSLARQEQQLYAGKHLLADSVEANEIAAKVTRKANDNSLLHISGYSSSSSSSSSSRTSTSTTTSRKIQNKSRSKHLNKNYAPPSSISSIKSTPSPLVTAATLKNNADVQTTTTAGNVRTYNFPPDDFHQLIDLHDFAYLISQDGCSRDIQGLILVHSAPANEEKRRLIRDTWANMDLLPRVNGVIPLRIIFLLGMVETEAQQLDIERENFENGDLIQGAFVDSYRNMTYKHVMAFKWFLYNCAHAQILIKVDDDVYVNTPQLLIYLERTLQSDALESRVGMLPTAAASMQHTADTVSNAVENTSMESSSSSRSSTSSSKSSSRGTVRNASAALHVNPQLTTLRANATRFNAAQMLFRHPQDLLFCKTTINAQVKRSYRSKWRVNVREYAGRYYPPYCPGFAIIYSPDVALALYNAAQVSTYFWIDDVHITGILAQNISAPITNAYEYILYEDDCDNLLNDVTTSDSVEFIYAWHLINPEQMQKLWELYLAKAKRHFSSFTHQQYTRTSTLSLLHKAAAAAAKNTPNNPTEFNKFKSYR
ncbi:uncharacterized protein LOC118747360 [Rhagoletis pomonella]|uniref:uncharacterized protein LOC118747360 n=1 Tax=Rhagoletis pomonella TaxID=28610 RepID=UPI00177BD19B|nr:uncharacterized protein LOC118747360 [Rhagoletis pomonella]